MRRRDIISGALTIVLLVLTCKHWLIFKPMPVSFLVKGNGSYTFTVQLNKKNNNEFKKIKQCTIKKHLTGGYEKCECKIDRVRFPKRLRLVVNTSDISPIEIKDITLKNGKYKLPSVSEFALHNAIPGGGGDVLMPSSSTFTLTYNEKLSVRSGIKFEAMTFIIIAVLGYLLSYKLTSYLADFKVLSDYSRLDILFLLVCAILMFLPMTHISDAKKSEAENRNLAVWKPFINKKGELNYNFGRDYDNCFNDRFNFREQLITFDTLLHFYLSGRYYETDTFIFDKKLKFGFSKLFNSQSLYLRTNLFTESDLKLITDNVNLLNEYCTKNNITLYLMFSSDKESIYPEFYSTAYIPKKNETRLEQVINVLSNDNSVNIIYPKDRLIEEKSKSDSLLFLRGDTHHSPDGYCSRAAYIEYLALVEGIASDYEKVTPISEKDFSFKNVETVGDIFRSQQFINDKYGKESVRVMLLKNPRTRLVETILHIPKRYETFKFVNSEAGNNLKAVMIGDSFHLGYRNILAENFAIFDSIFVGSGKDFILTDTMKKAVFDTKPDILIIETTERFLQRLLNMDSFMDIFEEKYRS